MDKDIDINNIKEKYKELNNVWKVGDFFGLTGQKVHSILTKEGVINKMNYWTKEDNQFLIDNYLKYRNNADLKSLAKIMNRTVPFICRKAKENGLTDKNSPVSMKRFGKEVGERIKKYIQENGHPKGFKGKHHSEESKKKISKSSKKSWSNPNHFLNSEEHKQNNSDRMAKMQSSGMLTNNYSRTKSGTIIIGGKTHFYRSEWEVNVAAYFEFLKNNNEIKDWEYEPETFWFEKIKRGVRSYKPDFRITNNDGTQYYEEVKGWMDNKSKTKLKRMKIYYPNVIVNVLDKKRYYEISKIKNIIPNWGDLSKGNVVEYKKCSLEDCDNKMHSKDLCRKHYYKKFKK